MFEGTLKSKVPGSFILTMRNVNISVCLVFLLNLAVLY